MSYDSVLTALTPIARWKLDDTSGTTAVAATGTNGTYSSSPTLNVTGLVSDGGKAVTTNGSSSFVTLPLPTLGSAGSIIFFSAHGAGGSAGNPIWRDATSAGGTGWFLDISGTNPIQRIGGSSHTVTGVTASTLRTGARHMYVLTTTGSAVKLYIDGTQVDSWSQAATFSQLTTSIILGKNGTNSAFYGGTFDDVAIIGSVITATDVSNLWAAATTSPGVSGDAAPTVTVSTSSAAKLGLGGAAAKTVTVATSSAGVRGKLGAAARTVTVASSSALKLGAKGAGARTLTVAASSAGVRGKVATAAVALTIAAVATGTVTSGAAGGAARTVTVSTSSALSLGVKATGTKALTVSTASTATRGKTATGSRTITVATASAARLGVKGSATAALTLTVTATGAVHEPARNINVLAIVDVSRVVDFVGVSRVPIPLETPRELTITEEVDV